MIKKNLIPLFLVILLSLAGCKEEQIALVSGNSSDYTIIISEGASEIESKAANELQRLLKLSTFITIPIETDKSSPQKQEIVIGNTNRQEAPSDLKGDGFLISTDENKLYIIGGAEKGVLYGVYTFLDKYLGYRYFAPQVLKHPSLSSIKIDKNLYDEQNPVNVYRNVFYSVTNDSFYADWHKLDQMKPDWGMWVHTFNNLLPASKYFNKNPEFYALVNGVRKGMQDDGHLHSQLCLSNPEVLRLVVENLGEMIKKQPEALYWSVSQSDTYPDQGYNCTCSECSKMDEESGSPSGSIITFVNKVASHFPDNIISTLAYRYSRSAPTAVKPAENVNIMLCDIECYRHCPIEEDPASESFRKDFEEWGKISNNILMWDYIIQFTNLIAPFPNLRTLQPNIQYFVRNGVTAHFQQGNISRGGEFCELRAYLAARLLWNPDVDIEKEIKEFLRGYYEEAAFYIESYINLMHDELALSGQKLEIYGYPYDHSETGFLRDDLMKRYERLFNEAEKAVSSKPEILARVQVARLPLTYALFDIATKRETPDPRVYEEVDGKWQTRMDAWARLESFKGVCNQAKIQHLREGGLTPEEYYNQMKKTLEEGKQ